MMIKPSVRHIYVGTNYDPEVMTNVYGVYEDTDHMVGRISAQFARIFGAYWLVNGYIGHANGPARYRMGEGDIYVEDYMLFLRSAYIHLLKCKLEVV